MVKPAMRSGPSQGFWYRGSQPTIGTHRASGFPPVASELTAAPLRRPGPDTCTIGFQDLSPSYATVVDVESTASIEGRPLGGRRDA